ncbi:MAG: mannose-1-phosphate guanylyltransferase/mannose-6-phosphate isomerase [Candidatus Omnitrophica bacterium]|nr:mannose-1-phosphate guanylyltransferase/mannose-6-phosphate isomerase [Candidatus Omnitrophota bacterium]
MNYAVILAGGTGTRFWPFSRELEPKQFMQIIGDKSLLQDTIKRIDGLVLPKNIFIVTNFKYLYEVKHQVAAFRISEANIILEPQGKNTAPAIGLCAQLISRRDKDATLIVLPSDHFIKNINKFRGCLKKAISLASHGLLVTLGIKPQNPSTGYGYIKTGLKKNGYFSAEKFLEKPDLAKAKAYFKDKRFYWNSGMFVWKASTFLEETRKYLPKLHILLSMIRSVDDIEKVWPKIDPISVDYGIMERSSKIALIPAPFYWTDLGSWDAMNALLPKDKSGNVIHADCLEVDSSGVSVFSRGARLISLIGVKDLIIVDTPDALLVCDKHKSQDVKKVVDILKSNKRKEQIAHTTEKRPWGSFTVLQNSDGFKIKLIEISPKKRLSLQRHAKRAEHWVVVSGCARVTTGFKKRLVHSNHSIYVPIGTKHRLENPGVIPLKIVEVQTGSYVEEDDIERFDDDFKR